MAKYSGCFVCGDNNSIGLKARFLFDGSRAVTEYTAEKRFEGYLGVFHGGITATLLDEVMIKALLAKDVYAMTVEMTVRFKKAVLTGEKLFFEGALESSRGRLFNTVGEVKNSSGEIIATATGKYLEVRKDMMEQLKKSLDT